MSKPPSKPRLGSNHNVVSLPSKPAEKFEPLHEVARPQANTNPLEAAGGPSDPRLQEALRLMESFLAIEGDADRAALITLADSLVSHDWVRKAQRR